MILKETGVRRVSQTRLIASVLVLLLLGLSVYFLFFHSKSYRSDNPDMIICDAEKTKNGFFISRNAQFANGKLQSSEFAKSGRYSCKITKGEDTQYGFSYTLLNPVQGTAYRASVWRLKNIYGNGNLAVQALGSDGFYLRESEPTELEDGWELLEIRFFIPFQKKIDQISIHVFSNGLNEVYFDDLKIEKVNHWQASDFQPEILELSINREGMEKLQEKRRQAIAQGILESSDQDWVSGIILQDSLEAIPVKLRLKGDWLDHLAGEKWSFRIRVEDSFAWKRMKTFSLHTPAARYFLHEWLLHQLWEREDVLTPRYDLVELRLNGQSLGIYAYEEHFEKQLVEYKKRREGPILKLSETGYWIGIKRQIKDLGYVRPDAAHSAMQMANADIETFKEKRMLESPELFQQFEQAQNLLLQFREGKQPASAIFDVPLLAKYYAVCDVLNAYHGIVWHNQRFYFNPVTHRLEPIGFDGYGEKPEQQLTVIGQGAMHPILLADEALHASLFLDEAFVRAYVDALYRISNKNNFKAFLDDIYEGWQPRLQRLQMEFPDYQADLNSVLKAAAYVHSLLLPFEDQSLKSYTASLSDGNKRLMLQNSHQLPIEVIGYGLSKKQPGTLLEAPILLPGHPNRHLLSRLKRDSSGKIDNFESVRFQESIALANQGIAEFQSLEVSESAKYLFFRPLGLDTVFYSRIRPWPAPVDFNIRQALFRDVQLESNDIFAVNGKQVLFRAGKHKVDSDLIIPEGYTVVFEAGAELYFTGEAAFISRSAVQFYGTEEQPVKLVSENKKANGFTVLQTREQSNLNYVIFDGLNTLNKKGWSLTGAVSFYEADVNLNRCVFRNIPCEDALNTVRSTFLMEKCHFFNLEYDAFDSDFCKGEIRSSSFVDVGNDGIDFSGSVVNIRDCLMQNCGDKGVSVGEESDVNVFASTIENCPIAFASKDLSVLYIEEVKIKVCDQAFVAYEKKAEFGGSKIIVKSYSTTDVKRLHAISKGCSLQLETVLITGE